VLHDCDEENEIPEIPLPNVSKETLAKVLEWCEREKEDPMPEIEQPIRSKDMKVNVGEWHARYIDCPHDTLVSIILAANYLEIPKLLQLGCAKLAALIKEETPEDIRRMFNIITPTPEEEAEIRARNTWIDE
jgi:S-phase kinase-associated protein 1